jgi:hypothetical protein
MAIFPSLGCCPSDAEFWKISPACQAQSAADANYWLQFQKRRQLFHLLAPRNASRRRDVRQQRKLFVLCNPRLKHAVYCAKTLRKKFHVSVKCRSSNSLEYTMSIMPIVFVLIILLFGFMSSLYSQGGNQNNNDSLDIQSRTSRR